MLNLSTSARLSQYLGRTSAILAAAGVQAPDLEQTAARWYAYRDATEGTPCADALAAAILDGADPALLAELHTVALAEAAATNEHRATVANTAADPLYQAARAAYAEHAPAVWATLKARFNKAARTFMKAAEVVDPETSAAAIVKADTRTRSAWLDAQNAAAELDEAAGLLADAANLMGRPDTPEHTLPLVAMPIDHHRRQVWDAYDKKDGQTRKWGALLALGIEISAGDIDTPSYRKPRPMETKAVQVAHGVFQNITVDPEDPTSPDEPQPSRGPRAVVV